MIEAFGNIWDHIDEYDAVVITTNGYVKKNGEAVMGRGIALEAAKRYPLLPGDLGKALKTFGNQVWAISSEYTSGLWIITMPVKPEYGPNGEPGWRVKADLSLIEDSAKALGGFDPYEGILTNINKQSLRPDSLDVVKVLMPRPGCGNGGLSWEVVKPVIEPYLDDRFTVMEKL